MSPSPRTAEKAPQAAPAGGSGRTSWRAPRPGQAGGWRLPKPSLLRHQVSHLRRPPSTCCCSHLAFPGNLTASAPFTICAGHHAIATRQRRRLPPPWQLCLLPCSSCTPWHPCWNQCCWKAADARESSVPLVPGLDGLRILLKLPCCGPKGKVPSVGRRNWAKPGTVFKGSMPRAPPDTCRIGGTLHWGARLKNAFLGCDETWSPTYDCSCCDIPRREADLGLCRGCAPHYPRRKGRDDACHCKRFCLLQTSTSKFCVGGKGTKPKGV